MFHYINSVSCVFKKHVKRFENVNMASLNQYSNLFSKKTLFVNPSINKSESRSLNNSRGVWQVKCARAGRARACCNELRGSVRVWRSSGVGWRRVCLSDSNSPHALNNCPFTHSVWKRRLYTRGRCFRRKKKHAPDESRRALFGVRRSTPAYQLAKVLRLS